MPRPVLFVCLGNICRSPAAEAVFRTLVPGHPVDSAGTGDWHIGAPPHDPMQDAARARGYDMSELRARQITARDFTRFELIVAMDAANRRAIEALRPAGNATPVHLLTDYAPERGMSHVPDPYLTHDFDGALDLIEACTRALAARL